MTATEGSDRDQLRLALGDLVIAFSEVELRLMQLVWYMLELSDGDGSKVTSALPFRRLVRLAAQLWADRGWPDFEFGEDDAAKYEAKTAIEWIFRELPKAEASRNIMLHLWWPDPSDPHWLPDAAPFEEEGQALRWKAPMRTGELTPTAVPISDIADLGADFYALSNGLAYVAGFVFGKAPTREEADASAEQ